MIFLMPSTCGHSWKDSISNVLLGTLQSGGTDKAQTSAIVKVYISLDIAMYRILQLLVEVLI